MAAAEVKELEAVSRGVSVRPCCLGHPPLVTPVALEAAEELKACSPCRLGHPPVADVEAVYPPECTLIILGT